MTIFTSTLYVCLQGLVHMYTQALAFKVRKLHPCLLSDVRFGVDLPDDDEVQVRSYMVSGGGGGGGAGCCCVLLVLG